MRKLASKTRCRIAVELIDSDEQSADALLSHVKGSTSKVVYRSPAYKGGRKYISVIETKDKEGSPFYHVQRLGQNSVAFLCHSDDRQGELLCLKQWSAPYQQMHTGTFTGSLDKDNKTVEDIVCEEAMEEAGLKVTPDRLTHVSDERVGGSTDETVHLYLIDITGLDIEDKQPENIYEQLAQRLWMTLPEINKMGEWKAKLIANHYAGHTLEDAEAAEAGTRQKAASRLAARPAPTLGWRDVKGRQGAMYYLQNAGFLFHIDYVMDIVPDEQGYKFALKFFDKATYQKAKTEVLDKLNKPGKLPFKVLAAANPPTDMTVYGDHGPIIDVPPVNVRNSYDFDIQGWPTHDLAEQALNWMRHIRIGSGGAGTDGGISHVFIGQHETSGAWQVIDSDTGEPYAPDPDDGDAGWHKAYIRLLRD